MAKTIGSFDLASLKNLRDDVTQYFWFESNSSSAWGSGAHVTLYPESQFTNPNHANYMKGQNIIMNTDGFSIRNGGLPMMVLDNDSLDFNVIDTLEGTYTTTATFTSTGAQIGQNGSAHSVIDANGQRFYASDGTTQLANIGYGEGASQSGGTSIAPYYTLGTRLSNSSVGNYSMAEGYNARATNFASHAEGATTQANGSCSHAEGSSTVVSGNYAHAEGSNCFAGGNYSHAEGLYTQSSGAGSHSEGVDSIATYAYSHAQNIGTKIHGVGQTVIGTYNVEDSTPSPSGPHGNITIYDRLYISSDFGNYAFIIGNGTADDARSNALTVDWDGNITINNHDSEIGHVYSASKSVAISNTTIDHNTDGASLTLSAGVYIVVGQWQFNTRSTTGTTNSAIRMYRSRDNYANNIAQQRMFSATNAWSCLQCTAIVELTSTETIKVCGATSRPYTTALGTYINAVRIK